MCEKTRLRYVRVYIIICGSCSVVKKIQNDAIVVVLFYHVVSNRQCSKNNVNRINRIKFRLSTYNANYKEIFIFEAVFLNLFLKTLI